MFDEFAKRLKELKEKKRIKEQEVSEVSKAIESLQYDILEKLDSCGLESADTENGKLSKKQVISCALPQTVEDRTALYTWLDGIIGVEGREALMSINSKTLQSIVSQEIKRRQEEGDLDISIPGVSEVKFYNTISFRK